MKTLLLTALLTISAPTIAETNKVDCSAVHALAEVVMKNRQLEISAVKMMEVAKDNELGLLIIKEAYNRPAYSVESNQVKSIKRFANEMFLACMEANEK